MNKEVLQAAKLIKAASECINRANALLKATGATAIDNPLLGYYNDKKEIAYHLYSGITKLTDSPEDIKTPLPPFKGFNPDNKKGWIKINGVNFFQLKDCDADKMILR